MDKRVIRNLAEGFVDDFDRLLEDFTKTQSTLGDFVHLWNSSKFHLIYCGRTTSCELLEFVEEAMRVVAHVLLGGGLAGAERGALYTLYALRATQHSGRPPVVRLISRQAERLQALKGRLEREREVEALYVLCSLLRDGVFRLVATERDYGLEKAIRKDLEYRNLRNTGVLKGLDSTGGLECALQQELAEGAALLRTYQTSKCSLPGGAKGRPCRELNYLKADFLTDALSTLKDLSPHSAQDRGPLPGGSRGCAQPPGDGKRKHIPKVIPSCEEASSSRSKKYLNPHSQIQEEVGFPEPKKRNFHTAMGLMNMPLISEGSVDASPAPPITADMPLIAPS